MPASLGVALRLVAGWDAGAFCLLTLSWVIILRRTTTKRSAARRRRIPAIGGVGAGARANTASLLSAIIALRMTHRVAPGVETHMAALCLVAVMVAWSLTHTACTLRVRASLLPRRRGGRRRAHVSRRAGAGLHGLRVLRVHAGGCCFQVSDVTITSRTVRHTALIHAVLSFLYNLVGGGAGAQPRHGARGLRRRPHCAAGSSTNINSRIPRGARPRAGRAGCSAAPCR